MQYGTIVLILFVTMLIYYAVVIVMDIRRLKVEQAAMQKDNEEDIDISDELKHFQPAQISREHPDGEPAKEKKNEEKKEDNPQNTAEQKEDADATAKNDGADAPKQESPSDEKKDETSQATPKEKPFRREGYREAVMTDGIPVERLIEETNKQVETGNSDLGAVIMDCEKAK